MKAIIGNRKSGKTTRLIKKAAANNGTIICNSWMAVLEIKKKAEEMGLEIQPPVTYSKALNGGLAGKNTPLYIDNLEMFLYDILHSEVDTITFLSNEVIQLTYDPEFIEVFRGAHC